MNKGKEISIKVANCIADIIPKRRAVLDKLHLNYQSVKNEEDWRYKKRQRALFKLEAIENLNFIFDSVCKKHECRVEYIIKVMALEDGLIQEVLED